MPSFRKADMKTAATYEIASREVVAVEHPMIVKNLENGLKTFGRGPAFSRILKSESDEACVPLYLRHNDPMSVPILSRNTPTNNVLLKITVPKRTGRKRKRGSHEPFSGDVVIDNEQAESSCLRSQSRLDDPAELLRSLKDNVGRYEVEAVAAIDHTHRFRGLADFHQSAAGIPGMQTKVRDLVSAGHVDAVRQFKFDPSMGWKKNEEIVPPALFMGTALPVNWAWHQHIASDDGTDEGTKKTRRARSGRTHVSATAIDIPGRYSYEAPRNSELQSLISTLEEVFSERPVWTRRALNNKVATHPQYLRLTEALRYVTYQFWEGPFRGCLVKYGLDPREDQKYVVYQTIWFHSLDQDGLDNTIADETFEGRLDLDSHLFDGKKLSVDGKVWQLCDITEPVLAKLIKSATLRTEFDATHDGYLSNGSYAKIKGIMRAKLLGILYNVTITDQQIDDILQSIPDVVDNNKKHGVEIGFSFLPFRLSNDELRERKLRGEKDLPLGCIFRPRERKRQTAKKDKPKKITTVNGPDKSTLPDGSPDNFGTVEKVDMHPIEVDGREPVAKESPEIDRQGSDSEDADMAEYEMDLAREDGLLSEDEGSEEGSGDDEELREEEDDRDDEDQRDDEDENENDDSEATDEADFGKLYVAPPPREPAKF